VFKASYENKLSGLDSIAIFKKYIQFGTLYMVIGIGLKYMATKKIGIEFQAIFRNNINFFDPLLRDAHNFNIRFLLTYHLK